MKRDFTKVPNYELKMLLDRSNNFLSNWKKPESMTTK